MTTPSPADTRAAFRAAWPLLAIPGEFDGLDACDQQRWRAVLEQAFDAGRAAALDEAAQIADAEASVEGIAQRIAKAIRERAKHG